MANGLEGNYLDIDAAHQKILGLGFDQVNRRQVQRWAGEKKLPFFKFGKSLYIEEQELLAAFRKMQNEAIRNTGK